MKTNLVKGFQDFTGKDAQKRAEIRKILVETFEKYGFEPAETPIIEEEKFVRGENPEDEVISDIYKLKDKGKRKLALRYEFTFQLKRLAKNKKLPYRRYQIGEVFRDEPVSSNRFRQFTQCDIDVVGGKIKQEAEILSLVSEVMKKLGIKFVIYFNNRKLLEGVLKRIFNLDNYKDIRKMIKALDERDKKSLREVLKGLKDKKLESDFIAFLRTVRNNDLEKLNSYFLGVLKNRRKEESYDKSTFRKGYEELKDLIKYCKYYKVPLKFDGSLARGLSYYNGTVFEVKTKGVKDAIGGGGSYPVNNLQATGISFGFDRLSKLAKIKSEKETFLVVSLGQDKEAIKLAQKIRKQGKTASLFYGKPSKALEYANSYNIEKVIFVGNKEVKSKKFKVKDMKSGKEVLLKTS